MQLPSGMGNPQLTLPTLCWVPIQSSLVLNPQTAVSSGLLHIQAPENYAGGCRI